MLALLGFLTIALFLVLVITKKLSVLLSLIATPVAYFVLRSIQSRSKNHVQ